MWHTEYGLFVSSVVKLEGTKVSTIPFFIDRITSATWLPTCVTMHGIHDP